MWIWVTVSAAKERSWSEPQGGIKPSSLGPQRDHFIPHPTLHPSWPVSGPPLLYRPPSSQCWPSLLLPPRALLRDPKSVPRMHPEAIDPGAVCMCSEGQPRVAMALSLGPDPQASVREPGLSARYLSLPSLAPCHCSATALPLSQTPLQSTWHVCFISCIRLPGEGDGDEGITSIQQEGTLRPHHHAGHSVRTSSL